MPKPYVSLKELCVRTNPPGVRVTDGQNLCSKIIYVIYQTKETVFHRDIQTPRRELKIRNATKFTIEVFG